MNKEEEKNWLQIVTTLPPKKKISTKKKLDNLQDQKADTPPEIQEYLETSWGWAGPSSVQDLLARQADVICFL